MYYTEVFRELLLDTAAPYVLYYKGAAQENATNQTSSGTTAAPAMEKGKAP